MSITVSISNSGITYTSSVSRPQATRETKSKKTSQVNNKTEAKENLEARVTELLDLKDNFLKASVIENNGKVYLKLSRPQNDKLRSSERNNFSMGAIKNKLGINNGVIKRNNNLKDITGRNLYEESDSATLESGKFILIPLNELGQDFSWYQFGRKDLVEYVKKYLETK